MITIDINNFVAEEIQKIDLNAIFQEELKKQVKETIQRTMKESLGTYSPLSKALDQMFKDSLKIDLSKNTLPEYNNFVVEQCHSVIKDLMSEERAKVIQKNFRDKLAPHLTDEIEFDKLYQQIEDSLIASLKEDQKENCGCSDLKYRIICSPEEKTYSSDYWKIAVYEGEKADSSSEMAVLYLSNRKSYHSRGKKNDSFAKMFSSFVFNNTIVHNMKDFDETISSEQIDY